MSGISTNTIKTMKSAIDINLRQMKEIDFWGYEIFRDNDFRYELCQKGILIKEFKRLKKDNCKFHIIQYKGVKFIIQEIISKKLKQIIRNRKIIRTEDYYSDFELILCASSCSLGVDIIKEKNMFAVKCRYCGNYTTGNSEEEAINKFFYFNKQQRASEISD